MSDQDWYSRNMGGGARRAVPPPPLAPMGPGRQVPQYQPQQPQQYQDPQYPPQPQQPQHQQYPQQQQPQQDPRFTPQQNQQMVEIAGVAHPVQEVAAYSGGIGQQMNPDLCPGCGGNQYFAHLKQKGRGPEPAGHCFNCFSGLEEYLTIDGLRTFADTVGTVQKVLNHEGKWVESEIKSFGTQSLQVVTFRPGLRRSNIRHTVVVTPDHRWLTDRGETTSLVVGDGVRFKGAGPWLGVNEAWVRGFGFGDGTLDARGQARVRLCGAKSRHEGKFSWYGHHSRYEYGGDPLFVFNKGHLTDWKHLPHDQDSEWLSSWLEGYLAADGEDKDGYYRLSTQDTEAAEFVKRIAPLAGYMVTGHNIESNMETNYGPRSAALHRLTLRNEGLFRVTSIEPLPEGDEVFCAVVPDGHSFTLANGIVTGNCGYNELFEQGDQSSWGSVQQTIQEVIPAGIQVNSSPFTPPSVASRDPGIAR